MAGSGDSGRRGPRGSKAQIDAVRRNAEKAAKQLDREQEESVTNLARALGEISEGEALASLDTRLGFLERQVERLAARRDEADRGVQGEMAVMRARIDDALEAVAATAQDQKEGQSVQEKRLSKLILESEHRSSTVSETLRQELVTKVQAAVTRLEKYEARLRGEMKAFEEGSDERARAVSESLARSRDEVEAKVDSAVQELTSLLEESSGELTSKAEESVAQLSTKVDGSVAAAAARLEEIRREVEKLLGDQSARLDERLNLATSRLEEGAAKSADELKAEAARLSSVIEESSAEAERKLAGAVDQAETRERAAEERITELESSVTRKGTELEDSLTERVSVLERSLTDQSSSLQESVRTHIEEGARRIDESLSEIRSEVETSQTNEKRELEGRFNEWLAGFRLEAQRLREVVEELDGGFEDRMDAARRDVLMRIQSAEEKAAAVAIRLESIITQQKRQLSAGEEEWSERLREVDEELSSLGVRVEELLGRISSSEAKLASDKGSREALLQSISGRIEHIEERVREAVEEVNAKHATRLEVLASQVAGFAESEVNAEEKLGAVDYLKRRVAEMAEHVDEIMVKVNAIGRYMTKPQAAAKLSLPFLPPDVADRLAAIEQAVAELASRPGNAALAVPAELTSRLDTLEQAVETLGMSLSRASGLVGLRESLEKRIAGLAESIAALEKPTTTAPERAIQEPLPAPQDQRVAGRDGGQIAQTILPEKKRPRW